MRPASPASLLTLPDTLDRQDLRVLSNIVRVLDNPKAQRRIKLMTRQSIVGVRDYDLAALIHAWWLLLHYAGQYELRLLRVPSR